jgi:acyl-coenzyme A synthetase/AMP-(fatty) acid ligase
MKSISAVLEDGAKRYRDRPAVSSTRGRQYTYGQLRDAVLRAVEWMERNDVPRPLLLSPSNMPQDVVLLLAAVLRRNIPLIADPVWTSAELRVISERTGASVLLTAAVAYREFEREGYEYLDRVVRRIGAPEHPSAIPSDIVLGRFTSGTTGMSRCLGFTEAAVLGAAAAWSEAAKLTANDVILCLATLNNGLAFNTSLVSTFLVGGHLVLHNGRVIPSSVARAVQKTQPSILVAFPFVYDTLAQSDIALPKLRLAMSSAAALSAKTEAWWPRHVGFAICNYYGVAEVGPVTFNDGAVPGSVGVPLEGVRIEVDPDTITAGGASCGRVRIATNSMASCFLDDQFPLLSESIDENGCYVTKDVGHLSGGRLFLTGRVGGVVNVGGRKVDPTEVADTIRSLIGVTDVVIRGEESGDSSVLTAYVESATVTRAEVIAHCRNRLASYKFPQRIVIAAALPRTSTGKVSFGRLKELKMETR